MGAMTTDDRTNEAIAEEAIKMSWRNYNSDESGTMPTEAEDAKAAVTALEAAGRLAGEPTDEQVEAAAREWYEQANGYETWASASGKHQQVVKVRAAKALVAATRVPVQGESSDDREAILRKALEHVREVGESGLAGPYVHDLPKDVDSNWGWLQTMWPVVVAVDIALASRATVPDAANRELTEAIRLTVEYVGNDMLPAIEGWEWYDALVKYAPEVAQAFVDKPIHFPKQTDAATEELARIKPLFENYSREYPNECNKRVKAEAERDAATAAITRVRAIHRETGAGGDCAVCNGWGWPCPTVAALDGAPEPDAALAAIERVRAVVKSIRFLAALPPFDEGNTVMNAAADDIVVAIDGAPEPEALELPETGLEVRDGDGDLITTGEHRRVLHQGGYVCDTCVNILGINVRWDRADRMEGHPLPAEGEGK